MDPALIAGLVLVAAFLLFVTEWIPVDLTALAAMILLALTKVLTPSEALSGFANPAIITVAALFVLSAALVRTGVVVTMGRWLAALAGRSENRAFLLLLLATAQASALINNTPVVLVFLPVALGVAEELRMSPSKLLIPIAFAATLGGMLTLVGTSTNVLVASRWEGMGQEPIGMFEFAPVGAMVLGAGLVYLFLFGKRLLPDRASVATRQTPTEYLSEITLRRGSSLVGKGLEEVGLGTRAALKVLQWIRGEEIDWPPFSKRTSLEAGDTLLVRGTADRIFAALQQRGFELLPELQTGSGRLTTSGMRLAEVVITPRSTLVGKTVEEAAFRRHYDLSLIAIQRRGLHVRERLPQMGIQVGDVLLVHGTEDAVASLRREEDFLLVEGIHETVPLRLKAPVAVAITAAFLAAASMGFFPIEFLALAAAGALVLSGCLTPREAYRSIDWSVLLLIVGTIAIGNAMEKTGLAEQIAGGMIQLLRPLGPAAVLCGVYLITLAMTEFLSNNAAALLMLPIAVAAANGLHANPRAFVMAVAFSATLAFAIPAGYQTYMLVYGPGSYRFRDFVKVGIPLDLIGWVLCSLLIPVFWPLSA